MNSTPPVQASAPATASVAIIDDEECVRTALDSLLRSVDVRSELFDCGARFLEQDVTRFALVLSDIQMPGISGIDLLGQVQALAPGLPVALMTAFPDVEWRQRAEERGAYRFLVKPLDADAVVDMVERALAQGDARRQ